MNALLSFAMVVALAMAGTAIAEPRQGQPTSPGVVQKSQDTLPKPQPGQTKPKPPPTKTKPFLGGSDDGTGI